MTLHHCKLGTDYVLSNELENEWVGGMDQYMMIGRMEIGTLVTR